MQRREVVFVVATRFNDVDFYQKSLLGRSLERLRKGGLIFRIILQHSNKKGLPEVYNRAIKKDFKHAILVFVHDDVFIDDLFILDRVQEALMHYDIVGVVGNTRCAHRQCTWSFPFKLGEWDSPEHLIGRISHILPNHPLPIVNIYGDKLKNQFPEHHKEVVLLDGVLLVADVARLLEKSVTFDEQFTFHHYDLDFCLTAKKAGLKLGVWPISISHGSGGHYQSEAWRASAALFIQKHWPQ